MPICISQRSVVCMRCESPGSLMRVTFNFGEHPQYSRRQGNVVKNQHSFISLCRCSRQKLHLSYSLIQYCHISAVAQLFRHTSALAANTTTTVDHKVTLTPVGTAYGQLKKKFWPCKENVSIYRIACCCLSSSEQFLRGRGKKLISAVLATATRDSGTQHIQGTNFCNRDDIPLWLGTLMPQGRHIQDPKYHVAILLFGIELQTLPLPTVPAASLSYRLQKYGEGHWCFQSWIAKWHHSFTRGLMLQYTVRLCNKSFLAS